MSETFIAEFPNPEALRAALRRVKEGGHHALDAFTPYPVEGLDEQLDIGLHGFGTRCSLAV